MGLYDGITETPVYGGGSYLGEGVHVVRVKKVLEHASDRAGADNFFIVEATILESSAPDHVVGTSRSQVVNMKHGKTSLSNIKDFALAACATMGEPAGDKDITPAVIEAFVGENNPCMGLILACEGIMIKTREKKQDFCKIRWTALTDVERSEFEKLDVPDAPDDVAAAA